MNSNMKTTKKKKVEEPVEETPPVDVIAPAVPLAVPITKLEPFGNDDQRKIIDKINELIDAQ